MFVRLPDWTARLGGFLEDVAATPFDWRSWNCCHLVDGAVLAMTGAAPLGDYAGAFEDEASAIAVLAARDGNLRAACRRVFGGCTPAPFAKRGDVVLLRGQRTIGICLGATCAFVGDAGVEQIALTECSFAFPLGWPAADSAPG